MGDSETTRSSPRVSTKKVLNPDRLNQWQLLCSPDGQGDSISLYQEVELYAGLISTRSAISYAAKNNRKIWIQVASGTLELLSQNGEQDCVLEAGDGVGFEQLASGIELKNIEPEKTAHVLLFDMAA